MNIFASRPSAPKVSNFCDKTPVVVAETNTEDISEKVIVAKEVNMTTGEDLMRFMVSFKEMMETTMEAVRKDIDKGMDTLTNKLTMSEEKQAVENKKVQDRLQKMEEDMRRLRFKRMQSNCVGKQTQPSGRMDADFQLETDLEDMSSNPNVGPQNQLLGRNKEKNQPEPLNMVRSNSWAEEMEQQLCKNGSDSEERRREREDDREQWTYEKRNPSYWSQGLDNEMRIKVAHK